MDEFYAIRADDESLQIVLQNGLLLKSVKDLLDAEDYKAAVEISQSIWNDEEITAKSAINQNQLNRAQMPLIAKSIDPRIHFESVD